MSPQPDSVVYNGKLYFVGNGNLRAYDGTSVVDAPYNVSARGVGNVGTKARNRNVSTRAS